MSTENSRNSNTDNERRYLRSLSKNSHRKVSQKHYRQRKQGLPFMGANVIRSLKNLLLPNNAMDEDSDSDVDEPRTMFNAIGPDTINMNNKLLSKASVENMEANIQPSCIEELAVDLEDKEDSAILDSRKCPDYTLRYCQSFDTKDIFIPMGNRINATSSCEDLVLEIELPGDNTPLEKMELGITEKELDFGSHLYRLKMPLVQRIDVHKTLAQFHIEHHLLVVVMRLKREFDFANF